MGMSRTALQCVPSQIHPNQVHNGGRAILHTFVVGPVEMINTRPLGVVIS